MRSRVVTISLMMAACCITASLFSAATFAMDLGLRCQAPPDAVFRAATETVREMVGWRSIHVVEEQRTIKAVVRTWRSFGVPIWIQIRPHLHVGGTDGSELHILWEQRMDPLSYPDVIVFMDAFGERQKTLNLDCRASSADIGL